MARRKLMTLEEIRKHSRAIQKGISVLSNELEDLVKESNFETDRDWQDETCEEDFIQDKVYGYQGADEIITELTDMLYQNRLDVKEMRRSRSQSAKMFYERFQK